MDIADIIEHDQVLLLLPYVRGTGGPPISHLTPYPP